MSPMDYGMEPLESRMLLAASVKVFGKSLVVVGELYHDETIVVRGTGTAGEVEVFTDGDNDGHIDSTPYGTYSGVKNISISTFNGDDVILVDGVEIAGNLKVYTGIGNDCTTVMGGTDIGRDLKIRSFVGTNVVELSDLTVGDDLVVTSLAGQDLVQLDRVLVKDAMKIKTGLDDDVVILKNTQVLGKATVKVSAGDDIVSIDEATVHFGNGSKLNGGSFSNDTLAVMSSATFDEALIGASIVKFEHVINQSSLPATYLDPFAEQREECNDRLTPN